MIKKHNKKNQTLLFWSKISYGAMDGSSKFVKGDAVAGIIITIVNLIENINRFFQHDMTVAQSGKFLLYNFNYWDGLAAQIPALILSTATAIIITGSKYGWGKVC